METDTGSLDTLGTYIESDQCIGTSTLQVGWAPPTKRLRSQVEQRARQKHFHLLSGLFCESVTNPAQCSRLFQVRARETPSVSSGPATTRNPGHSPLPWVQSSPGLGSQLAKLEESELVELDWRNSVASMSYDLEERQPACRGARWKCQCLTMTIDEIQHCKQLRPSSASPDEARELVDGIGAHEWRSAHQLAPSSSKQMSECGCKFSRKRLLRLVGFSRKFKRKIHHAESVERFGDYQEHGLYELERQTELTNDWLAQELARIARIDARRLECLSSEMVDDEEEQEEGALLRARGNPVGARQVSRRKSQYHADHRHDSECSSTSRSLSSSDDSGISLVVRTSANGSESSLKLDRRQVRFHNLESYLELRSSQQFRAIIAFSCQFFSELLLSNPLLEFTVGEENRDKQSEPVTLNQLRVFARVESQKLRAKLRFEWLPKCFWLAFEGQPDLRRKPSPSGGPPDRLVLPSIYLGAPNKHGADGASSYLEALARLMGYLLRRHFLESALDKWIESLRQHLAPVDNSRKRPKLVMEVQVLVDAANDEVSSSRPEGELRESLDFIVDEISSACSKMPRLECQQLEEQQHIVVLTDGDELLLECKQTAAKLLDAARSHDAEFSSASSWVSRGHLRLISIINKFRSSLGELSASEVEELSNLGTVTGFKLKPTQARALMGFEMLSAGDSESAATSSSYLMEQLELTCKQIKLLNELEFELKCQLEAHSSFGQLVELDLSKLNAELAKIIDKERLLLVRFKADELFKLMEGLRKQFDELELNIDLEAAIEDYLNDRWRVKQSQQPGIEQQILLDEEGLRAEEIELDQTLPGESYTADGPAAEERFGGSASATATATEAASSQQHDAPSGYLNNSTYHEEDEYLNALVSRNNPKVAHLFAMSDPTGGANQLEQELAQAPVAPLIESRLLVERYKYLNNFLTGELDLFLANLGFSLVHGLAFLCEFGWWQNWSEQARSIGGEARRSQAQALEPEQLELLAELSLRAREFSLVLGEALDRLERAHVRLVGSMRMRADVLSRIILEFDWLMGKLAERRLEGASDEDANIKQLDFIQDTASWSQKLNWRLEFLVSQNELIERESRLLLVECQQEFGFFGLITRETSASAQFLSLEAGKLRSENEEGSRLRSDELTQWRSFAKLINEFWLLTEEFETQQVKWLNSDSKKLDFQLVQSVFEEKFQSKLNDLREAAHSTREYIQLQLAPSSQGTSKSRIKCTVTLASNIEQLQARLDEFRGKCMPILRFLTNRHLTEKHWIKLQQLLLDSDRTLDAGLVQIYTTVAQLLELGVTEELVAQLEQMSHLATIEHELSELIATEIRRQESGWSSLESQLKSLEALARLDLWSPQELALAAARFIKLKLSKGTSGAGRDELMIELLASQLVACHISVKRSLRLSSELNLERAPNYRSYATMGAERRRGATLDAPRKTGPCTVVVRSRLANAGQQVGGSLLVEFLRLFTEIWLESESRLAKKLARVGAQLANTREHLVEVDQLLGQVDILQAGDSRAAICENEAELAELQRASLKLELEREILATRESASLELQSEALRFRDTCVKQISERAIPAIRAATRALDCLGDGRSLRALKSYRPSPPLAVRLVIEAVCLLRNICCQDLGQPKPASGFSKGGGSGDERLANAIEAGEPANSYNNDKFSLVAPLATAPGGPAAARLSTSPRHGEPKRPIEAERRFDAMRGQIVEDYWPVAWRTLNGVHSSQFVADLRRVNQGTRIPHQTMALIRRKYLRRPEFQLAKIERHSRETGQLARWLLAVDVFERVISIIRPNYDEYLKAEASLAATLSNVSQRRAQIDTIGRELEHMEESIRQQVSRRVRLVDLVDDCVRGSASLSEIRAELAARKRAYEFKLNELQAKIEGLAQASLWRSARLIYLEALPSVDRALIEYVLERERANCARLT